MSTSVGLDVRADGAARLARMTFERCRLGGCSSGLFSCWECSKIHREVMMLPLSISHALKCCGSRDCFGKVFRHLRSKNLSWVRHGFNCSN